MKTREAVLVLFASAKSILSEQMDTWWQKLFSPQTKETNSECENIKANCGIKTNKISHLKVKPKK